MKYLQRHKQHTAAGRSPCGERGLKFVPGNFIFGDLRRSPCGERGLKFHRAPPIMFMLPSLPVRGAWIEITPCRRRFPSSGRSLPVRGAWIEINPQRGGEDEGKRRSPCGERGLKWLAISEWLEKRVSLPVRGAWIEILLQRRVLQDKRESLPVRGAWIEIIHDRICGRTIVVAPRAGSVD